MLNAPKQITEVERQLKRVGVADIFEIVDHTEDGAYVRLADGGCAWCHPTKPLLQCLRALPDNAFEDIQADERNDIPADAMRDAAFCQATTKVGYFGHNEAGDTMDTPENLAWGDADAYYAKAS
jgi:hypothetical protein